MKTVLESLFCKSHVKVKWLEKHTREIVKTKVMSLTETSFIDYLSKVCTCFNWWTIQYGKLTTCTSTSSTLITTLGSTWRINALLVFLFTLKCFLTSDDLIRQGTIWKVLSLYFASRRKNRPRPASSQVRTLQLDERVLKSQRNVSQQIGFQVEKTSQQPASDVRHKKDFFHMSLSNKVIHF